MGVSSTYLPYIIREYKKIKKNGTHYRLFIMKITGFVIDKKRTLL